MGGQLRVRMLLRRGALLLLATAVVGCGGMGDVSGVVKYNGEPLEFGTIQFLGSDGIPYSAKIEAGGKYSIRVPVGEAKVAITSIKSTDLVGTPKKAPQDKARLVVPKGVPQETSRIPPRYGDWKASGLRLTVTRGSNDFSPTLTD